MNKKRAQVPAVTMTSSPTDLALLAENQLFQAYQVVYYNEAGQSGTSSASNANAAATNSSVPDGVSAGGFTGRNGDTTSKSYAMKSSKVPHKPIE